MWLIAALGSALFAGITSLLVKIGMQHVDANLATTIRTAVVAVFAWLMVFVTGAQATAVSAQTMVFLVLSGLATGLSWLCYYDALQNGPASVVVPIDKLSILVTIAFASIFMHEKLSRKSTLGLVMIVAGTLMMIVG